MEIQMIEYGKEIRLGEHRVYVSEDNIIHVTSIGEIDDESANAILDISREMMKTQKDNLKVAIDCNKTGKPSPKARGVFQELGRNERVAKVAAFGLHPVAKIIATFGMGAEIKKGRYQFFNTEKQAIKWLNE
jgi:hypothetical protein